MSTLEPITSPEQAPANVVPGDQAILPSSLGGPAGMLFAKVTLRAPAARSILVATPTTSARTPALARDLAAIAATAGHRVRLVDLSRDLGGKRNPSLTGTPDWIEEVSPPAASLLKVEAAREVLTVPDRFTVAFGAGLLDNPATLIAAALVDGVVVVTRKGKTTRQVLDLVRSELERVGGQVLGAVLQD